MHNWHIFEDTDNLADAAARYLVRRIGEVLQSRDTCHIALPGGSAPIPTLNRLAAETLPWERIHWYVGDERCAPLGHADRNDRMLAEQLWDRVPVAEENRHPIRAELGPVDAATDYAEQMMQIGHLDIVLLGMGPDGHTASLFPGNPALALTEPVVPVFDSPKPPPERVTLSVPFIQGAESRMAIITGAGKADMIDRVRRGEPVPINQVGAIEMFVDTTAAGPSESS